MALNSYLSDNFKGMKFHSFLAIFLLGFLISCDSDLMNIGSNIQPSGDGIILKVDSFAVSSENYKPEYIYSRPDSFMLGSFYDEQYGDFRAEILTQLMPPIDVVFPANAKADSANLFLDYGSSFGDALSPFEINVYRMDLKTLSPTAVYTTGVNVTEFSSSSVKMGSKVTTVNSYGVKRDSTLVYIKMNDSFVADFASELKKKYTKQTASTFFDAFKGIHLKTQFGSETLINVKSIVMRYYYHYTYVRKTVDGSKDSTVTVNHYQDYPATDEVRTISSVKLPRQNEVFQNFSQNSDVNVVSSPGNIYTNLTLPMAEISARLNSKVGSKKLLINRAMLKINVAELDSNALALPLISSLLLINEDSVPKYFKKRSVPTSAEAITGTLSYGYVNNKLAFYYNFDMAQILTTELAKTTVPNVLKFRLMPVGVSKDGSGYIKDVKERETPGAVKLCSGSHGSNPMRLHLVYSGF